MWPGACVCLYVYERERERERPSWGGGCTKSCIVIDRMVFLNTTQSKRLLAHGQMRIFLRSIYYIKRITTLSMSLHELEHIPIPHSSIVYMYKLDSSINMH